MNWKTLPLKQMHIELSSHCNAACPLCPRTYENTNLVRPDLKLTSISFEDFKRYFPKELLEQLKLVNVCGTMGDPIMAKDCFEIFEYLAEVNPACRQEVHTNGGMRSPEFWSKMGKLFQQKQMTLIFSIDGLEDTNHLYRRNVDWNTLMKNVNAFITAGGNAVWEYLVFKHNEHQIEEAKKLAKSLGFQRIEFKRAFGFEDQMEKKSKPRAVYNQEGKVEYKIYAPTIPEYQNIDVARFTPAEKDYGDIDLTEYNTIKTIKIHPAIKRSLAFFTDESCVHQLGDYAADLNSKSIKCKSHLGFGTPVHSEIYVNAQGIVFPCCFVGTRYDSGFNYFIDNQLKSKINSRIEDLDLNLKDLEEILTSGVLDEIFTASWQIPEIRYGKIAYCAEMCGENNAMDKLYVGKDY